MLIRFEESKDHDAVHKVNAAAFESPAEANLVDILRNEASPIVSLVAEEEGAIAGHILFSPVTLSGNTALIIMGLGPMAVMPKYQKKGIGSNILVMLIKKCLDEKIRDIQLFCAKGKRRFYEKYDFIARPDDGPGMDYNRQN